MSIRRILVSASALVVAAIVGASGFAVAEPLTLPRVPLPGAANGPGMRRAPARVSPPPAFVPPTRELAVAIRGGTWSGSADVGTHRAVAQLVWAQGLTPPAGMCSIDFVAGFDDGTSMQVGRCNAACGAPCVGVLQGIYPGVYPITLTSAEVPRAHGYGTYDVDRAPVTVVLTGARTGALQDGLEGEVRLQDSAGNALWNVRPQVTVDGVDRTAPATGWSWPWERFSSPLTRNTTALVAASYAGSGYYKPASAQMIVPANATTETSLLLNPPPPRFDVDGPLASTSFSIPLDVTLRSSASAAPIAGANVRFYAYQFDKWRLLGSVTTDAMGHAHATSAPMHAMVASAAVYTVDVTYYAVYDGSPAYAPSSASATITVNGTGQAPPNWR